MNDLERIESQARQELEQLAEAAAAGQRVEAACLSRVLRFAGTTADFNALVATAYQRRFAEIRRGHIEDARAGVQRLRDRIAGLEDALCAIDAENGSALEAARIALREVETRVALARGNLELDLAEARFALEPAIANLARLEAPRDER